MWFHRFYHQGRQGRTDIRPRPRPAWPVRPPALQRSGMLTSTWNYESVEKHITVSHITKQDTIYIFVHRRCRRQEIWTNRRKLQHTAVSQLRLGPNLSIVNQLWRSQKVPSHNFVNVLNEGPIFVRLKYCRSQSNIKMNMGSVSKLEACCILLDWSFVKLIIGLWRDRCLSGIHRNTLYSSMS